MAFQYSVIKGQYDQEPSWSRESGNTYTCFRASNEIDDRAKTHFEVLVQKRSTFLPVKYSNS